MATSTSLNTLTAAITTDTAPAYDFGATRAVLTALDSMADGADGLHEAFVDMVRELSTISKRSIKESADLAAIFSHGLKGLDRKRMLGWVTTHTPIRPKFAENGQFEKIGFAKNPVWDIEGAEANPWYDHEAARTTKVRGADLDKALKALATATAKVGAEADMQGTGDTGQAVRDIRKLVNSDKFVELIHEVMAKDSFAEWLDGRSDALLAEAQAEARKKAEEAARVNDKRAAIQRAMGK